MAYYINKEKENKEKKYFPADYPNFKIIKTFTKPRSPRTKIFATDDPEGWFIDLFSIKSKTREVVNNEGWITKKDIPNWVTWYESLGWIEKKT